MNPSRASSVSLLSCSANLYYHYIFVVTAALYPQACATLGICQLAIADPTASYFGRATRHVYWSRIEK